MKTPLPRPDAIDVLRQAGASGLYACSEEHARSFFQAGPAAGFNACRIDLGLAHDAARVHDILSRALHFPEWYGRNWDALADCLCDLSWEEADGYVLIFQRADSLQRSAPEAFATLLAVLADAAAFWRDEGVAFWVLFIGQFPQIGQLEARA
ncbi:MAG: barstar family protein [Candidatus Dactylopiibacterium sp.]|nr:barstar family protein [Candidatus Dactylopiibacterium sp.]